MRRLYRRFLQTSIFKSAFAYLLIGWILLQVADIILPAIGSPDWHIKLLIFILIIGFPVWLFFSWISENLKKGDSAQTSIYRDPKLKSRSIQVNILFLIMGISMIGAIVYQLHAEGIFNSYFNTSVIKKNSIAVMPFDHFDDSNETRVIGDGFMEDILTLISRIDGLKVTSRTSMKKYRNTDKGIPQIGQELGVAYILEGSVRKIENKMRVTVQLIDTFDDEHLWAEYYDWDIDDIFKAQSEISNKIAKSLQIALSPQEQVMLTMDPNKNIEAYHWVVQGRHESDKQTKMGIENSILLFNKALAIDSTYALALAEKANSKFLLWSVLKVKQDSLIIQANENVRKAFSYEPNSYEAHRTKGLIQLYYEKEYHQAKASFQKALDVQLNSSIVNLHLSKVHLYLGDTTQAIEIAKTSLELSPLSYDSNVNYFEMLIKTGQKDEALKIANKIRDYFTTDEYDHFLETAGQLLSS